MSLEHSLSFNVNDSSNATFAAITPSRTDLYVHPKKLNFSLQTADLITIKFGTTTIIGPLYMPATSGMMYDIDEYKYKGKAGEALNITKGSAVTAVTVFGLYIEE